MNATLPSQLQRLRVFVASPGDVDTERGHVVALAEELNREIAARDGFVLDIVQWKTHTHPAVGRPQQVILDQVGDVDLVVGILWSRMGTPTGVAESGTEEELAAALTSNKRTGSPEIFCYFSEAPIKPPVTIEQVLQLEKVVQLRLRLAGSHLAHTYADPTEFKDRLRQHLQQWLRERAGRTPPLDRNLLQLLETEKHRCRDQDVPFATPNLLLALIGGAGSPARKVLDTAARDKVARVLEGLRSYRAEPGATFADFDWNARKDVQEARRQARQAGRTVIDARLLLLGFLETDGATRRELRSVLGDERFNLLRRVAAAQDPDAGTPGVRGLMATSASTDEA